jgi:hypothetical protein
MHREKVDAAKSTLHKRMAGRDGDKQKWTVESEEGKVTRLNRQEVVGCGVKDTYGRNIGGAIGGGETGSMRGARKLSSVRCGIHKTMAGREARTST